MIAAMRQTTISPEELSEIKDDAAWELAKVRFRKEGRQEQTLEMARRMLQKGLETAMIAELTGLSLAEIGEIEKQN
jgi:predicted transposase/invertase (TIGR01784 family)